jgi:HEAT repeat protein
MASAAAHLDALTRGPRHLRQAAADAILRLPRPVDEKVIQALLSRCKSGPVESRPAVLAALGGALRGAPGQATARELLLGVAESDDDVSAHAAVDALAALHDRLALPRLVRLLGHARGALAVRLVAAIGELRPAEDPALTDLLIARLADESAPVRAEAAWALGKRAGAQADRAASALCQAIRAPSAAVRANAAGALAHLHRPCAALQSLSSDPDPAVRENAALAAGSAALAGGNDWMVLHLIDADGSPLPRASYALKLPDGITKIGSTDSGGSAREESLPTGDSRVEVTDPEGARPY